MNSGNESPKPFTLLLFQVIGLFLCAMLAVAFFSLFERKLLSYSQNRVGPNKVGQGILQPIADAMKLISKEEKPSHSSFFLLYFASPLVFFSISSLSWVVYPILWGGMSFLSSTLFILIVLSISVFGIILSGWFSNSKYATIGTGRAFIQSISYEIGLTTIIMIIMVLISSFCLKETIFTSIEGFFFISLSPFFISSMLIFLAELNRTPFDLSEGESELVSGYSVEYGGLSYTLLFLGENLSILWSSILIGVFFGCFLTPFVVWLFVQIRASFPRIRFDKMVSLFWISCLPIILMESIKLTLFN